MPGALVKSRRGTTKTGCGATEISKGEGSGPRSNVMPARNTGAGLRAAGSHVWRAWIGMPEAFAMQSGARRMVPAIRMTQSLFKIGLYNFSTFRAPGSMKSYPGGDLPRGPSSAAWGSKIGCVMRG